MHTETQHDQEAQRTAGSEERPAACGEGLRAAQDRADPWQDPSRPIHDPESLWSQISTADALAEEAELREARSVQRTLCPCQLLGKAGRWANEGPMSELPGLGLLPEAGSCHGTGRASPDMPSWETGSAWLLVRPESSPRLDAKQAVTTAVQLLPHAWSKDWVWARLVTDFFFFFTSDLEEGIKQHLNEMWCETGSRQVKRP